MMPLSSLRSRSPPMERQQPLLGCGTSTIPSLPHPPPPQHAARTQWAPAPAQAERWGPPPAGAAAGPAPPQIPGYPRASDTAGAGGRAAQSARGLPALLSMAVAGGYGRGHKEKRREQGAGATLQVHWEQNDAHTAPPSPPHLRRHNVPHIVALVWVKGVAPKEQHKQDDPARPQVSFLRASAATAAKGKTLGVARPVRHTQPPRTPAKLPLPNRHPHPSPPAHFSCCHAPWHRTYSPIDLWRHVDGRASDMTKHD